MVKPGIYIAGRPIKNDLDLHVTHQFVILIPNKNTTLTGIKKSYKGVSYLLMGAYNIKGYLRAKMYAPSDDIKFKQFIDRKGKGGTQIEPVEVLSCLADPDLPMTQMYRAFTRYKTFEGKKDELKYPKDLLAQFDSSIFNSNSWAQSCVYWGCFISGSKAISDFKGIDIGRQRRIPNKYFR